MGILILFILFSKLKPLDVFSHYLVEVHVSIFFSFLVCVDLVSTILAWENCFSTICLVWAEFF
jgi:hypothetical protein